MREQGQTGVQTHVRAVRRVLDALGVPVECVTPFAVTPLLVYPLFGMRRLIELFSRSASIWWYRYWHALLLRVALRRRLRRGQAAVVYAQCPVSAAAAIRARATEKQSVVLVVHFNVSQADEWAEKGALRRGGLVYDSILRFEAQVLPSVDGLVYVSGFMQRVVEARVPAACGVKHMIVPNFLPARELPLQAVTSDLITVGTLEPRKNQGFLLQVLAAARTRGHRYSLSIVGDGPDREQLQRMATQLGVADQVRFLGFQPDAAGLIGAHRAYCHAATLENLPLSLIEAMRSGKPIFAGGVGGIPELVVDGETGVLWPLADPNAAADLLVQIMEDPASLVRLGSAARARFKRNYCEDVVGPMLRDFLCGVPSSPTA
jgi:glycosyltransferase involved in cell wall biosynthesis